MGILQRVARFVGVDAPPGEAALALLDAYAGSARRAAQLREHAEIAPHENSAAILRDLAGAEDQQVRRLREAMQGLRITPPGSAVADRDPVTGQSHWVRVVQDLEEHRRAVQKYREAAIKLAEAAPALATLFEELSQEEYAHCEILRGLVARADPQALN